MLLVVCFMSAPIFAAQPKGPCEEELETYCADVHPGQGRMSDCLKKYDHMLSKECKDYLAKSSEALKGLQADCAEDTHEYCRNVKTSYRRIIHCLKEHTNEISAACRERIKTFK